MILFEWEENKIIINAINKIYNRINYPISSFLVAICIFSITYSKNIVLFLLLFLLLILFLIIFFVKIYQEFNEVRANFLYVINLEHFGVNSYQQDLFDRRMLYRKILKILFWLSLIILSCFRTKNINVQNKVFMYLLLVLTIFSILFLIQKFHSVLSTLFLIIVSHLLLFCITLVIVIMIIITIISTLNGQPQEYITQMKFLYAESIYLLELFLGVGKDYNFVWIFILSFCVQIFLVLFRPPYLFEKTRLSFKLISMISSSFSIIVTIYNKQYSEIIYSFINSHPIQFDGLLTYINTQTLNDFNDYYNNCIQTVFFPFTVGNIICLFILDYIEVRRKERARHFFQQSLQSCTTDSELTIYYLKKSIYFGFDHTILFAIPELRVYVDNLQVNEHLSLSVFNRFIRNINRIINNDTRY